MSRELTTLDGARHELSDETIAEIREIFHGDVVTPDDSTYDETRVVQNGMFDRHPRPDRAMHRRRRRRRLRHDGPRTRPPVVGARRWTLHCWHLHRGRRLDARPVTDARCLHIDIC